MKHDAARARSRSFGAALALAALGAPMFAPAECRADAPSSPQVTTALTVGGGVSDVNDRPARAAAFHLGSYTDVLFLRNGDTSVGLGPYLQAATTAFSSFELSAGPTVLVPLGSPVLQLSAGPNLRLATGGPYPGILGRLFLGSRSHNFHGVYGFAVGGFLETRTTFYGSGKTGVDLIGGLQVDVVVLALPFLYALEAIRGPRDRR